MTRMLLPVLLVLLLLGGAGCQTAPPAPPDPSVDSATANTPSSTADEMPTEVTCAVMTGNKVNIEQATAAKMYADHEGKRYFFCCAGCPEKFKANPAQYADNASIPAPE